MIINKFVQISISSFNDSSGRLFPEKIDNVFNVNTEFSTISILINDIFLLLGSL